MITNYELVDIVMKCVLLPIRNPIFNLNMALILFLPIIDNYDYNRRFHKVLTKHRIQLHINKGISKAILYYSVHSRLFFMFCSFFMSLCQFKTPHKSLNSTTTLKYLT